MALDKLVRVCSAQVVETRLLVLLHGLGSDESDLFGLVPDLDERFTVVSFRAPKSYSGGFAWFNLEHSNGGYRYDWDEVEQSGQELIANIREVQSEFGFDGKSTLIAGFSQGGMMTAFVAVHAKELSKTCVLLSGLVLPQTVLGVKPGALDGSNFLIQHGVSDPIIPLEWAADSVEILKRYGASVDYREYPMGHSMSEESFEDFTNWLNERAGF